MKIITVTFMLLHVASATSQTIIELCQSQTLDGTIVNSEIYNDSIYITGFFTQICGQSTNYLAKWQNGTWVPKNIGLTDPGHSLRNIDDTLYIARYEESIDSNWLYRYDGNSLTKFGQGIYLTTASGFSELPNLYDVVKYDGALVVCGEFDRAGSQIISGIMRWNGTQWADMGGGLTGNIISTAPVIYPHQMMVYNNNLYVVGNFRYAGGIEVNGVAMWDGSQWHAMGNGFNNTAYAICVYNNEIYAGGSFTESGSTPINRLAKWNGTEWISPGFGLIEETANDFIFVHTLKEIDGDLHIAGGLKNIEYNNLSTELCGGIISYNGSTINTFNGGVSNNDIEAVIKDTDGSLLLGGGVFGNGYTGIVSASAILPQLNTNSIFKIYPNPTQHNGAVNIELQEPQDYSLLVKNILGEAVLKKTYINLKTNTVELDLPRGEYTLTIQLEHSQHTQMLILK